MTSPLVLSGPDAFYSQPGFAAAETATAAQQRNSAPVVYRYTTESKAMRVFKLVIAIVVFPIGLYKLAHGLAGRILLPASLPGSLTGMSSQRLSEFREGAFRAYSHRGFICKRIALEVDGRRIDAMLLSKPETIANGRWGLFGGGNGEYYETKVYQADTAGLISNLKMNAILFNYPGVGGSTGGPNRKAMTAAYKALLSYLEDKEHGIGAREIIGYGHSIGGGNQGDALKGHQFKLSEGVRYAFVKSRTFANLESTAAALTHPFLGRMVRRLGWNMSSVESSKTLPVPEVILTTARVEQAQDIRYNPELIEQNDGVIPGDVSLAKALLESPEELSANKHFLGIPEGHNDQLSDNTVGAIAELVESALTA